MTTDARRSGRWLQVLGVMMLVLAGLSAFGGPAHAVGPAAQIVPSTNLHNGDTVTVSGSGFPAHANIVVLECQGSTASPPTDNTNCDGYTGDTTQYASTAGTFSLTGYTIYVLPVAGGNPNLKCDSTHACVIFAGVAINDFTQAHAFVDIGFASGVVGPTTTTTPPATTTTTQAPATTTTSTTTPATTSTTHAPTSTTSSTTSSTIVSGPHLGLTATTTYVGATMTATVTGFPAGQIVTWTFNSTPITLGTSTATSAGSASLTFTVPSVATGTHTVTATSGSVTASASVTVGVQCGVSAVTTTSAPSSSTSTTSSSTSSTTSTSTTTSSTSTTTPGTTTSTTACVPASTTTVAGSPSATSAVAGTSGSSTAGGTLPFTGTPRDVPYLAMAGIALLCAGTGVRRRVLLTPR